MQREAGPYACIVLPALAGMARSAASLPAAARTFSPHARGWPGLHHQPHHHHRGSPPTRGDGPNWRPLLDDNGLANRPIFLTGLEAVQQVLPLSARYTGFDPVKAAAPAASDFKALENLRCLALAEQVLAPKHLELVLAERAEES